MDAQVLQPFIRCDLLDLLACFAFQNLHVPAKSTALKHTTTRCLTEEVLWLDRLRFFFTIVQAQTENIADPTESNGSLIIHMGNTA